MRKLRTRKSFALFGLAVVVFAAIVPVVSSSLPDVILTPLWLVVPAVSLVVVRRTPRAAITSRSHCCRSLSSAHLPPRSPRLTTAASAGRFLSPRTNVQQEGIVQRSHSTHRRLRNRIGWRQRLARLQGSPVTFDLARLRRSRWLRSSGSAPTSSGCPTARSRHAPASCASGPAASARVDSRRVLCAGSRGLAPRPRPAAVRRPGPRRDRARSRPHRRDADRRGKDARRGHAGGAARAHRAGRARPDVQRLPGAPRRRVDGAGLRDARALGRVRPAGHDTGGTPSRLPRRRHLCDRQGGGIRSSARSAGDGSSGARSSAVPLRARRRSRLAAHRRGARAAGHRRERRSRDLVARRGWPRSSRRSRRASTSTPTSTAGTSS